MLLFDLEQRSPEWLQWRKICSRDEVIPALEQTFQSKPTAIVEKILTVLKKGVDWPNNQLPVITATDWPAIDGTSKWDTAYSLFRKKVGLDKPQKQNVAMSHGTRTEDEARLAYESESGVVVTPVCAQSDDYPFIRASLDGLSFCGSILAEIKCPYTPNPENTPASHQQALSGHIPANYIPQVVGQQFCVPEAEMTHYWSYFNRGGVMLPFQRNNLYQDVLLDAVLEFYWGLLTKTPPVSEEWLVATTALSRIKNAINALEVVEKHHREQVMALFKVSKKAKLEGEGLVVSRYPKKGTVDKDNLYRSFGISPEQVEIFRGPPSEEFKITPTR